MTSTGFAAASIWARSSSYVAASSPSMSGGWPNKANRGVSLGVSLFSFTRSIKPPEPLVHPQTFLRALAHFRDIDGPGKTNRRQIFTGRGFSVLEVDLKVG